MRPPEVLDHQAALVDYVASAYYGRVLGGFLQDMSAKRKISVHEPDTAGVEFSQVMVRGLRVAEAFHVAREMVPVLRAAAAELESTDYLVHERIPAEHGFLVFDDGWVSREIRGRAVTVNALQWWHGSAVIDGTYGRSVPGIWVVTFTDINDERDEVTAEMRERDGEEALRAVGRYHVAHIQFISYGQRVGPYEVPEGYYQEYLEEFPDPDISPASVYTGTLPNDTRMLVALFRLLGQSFVEVRDAPLDRASARRATRKRLPARVQTITLRRKVTRYLNPGEGGDVQWQHSWWVKGSWQWRKCGAEHPMAEEYDQGWHARVYVRGHPKGPANLPMLITNKVGSLRR